VQPAARYTASEKHYSLVRGALLCDFLWTFIDNVHNKLVSALGRDFQPSLTLVSMTRAYPSGASFWY
jgi:hypothetical protein